MATFGANNSFKTDAAPSQILKPKESTPEVFSPVLQKKIQRLLRCLLADPCSIMGRTKLLTLPMTHDELAAMYRASRELPFKDVSILNNGNEICVEATYTPDPSDYKTFKRVAVVADLRSVITELCPTILQFSWDAIVGCYMYIANCIPAFNVEKNSFFHIDDVETYRKHKRAADGLSVEELWEKSPWKQLSFMNYTQHKGPIAYDNSTLRMTHDGGYNKGIQLKDHLSRFKYPECDMAELESRMYMLYFLLARTQEICPLDTETTGLDIFSDTLVSLGICFDSRIGFYFSVDHRKRKSISLIVGESGILKTCSVNSMIAAREQGIQVKNSFAYINKLGDNTVNLGLPFIRDELLADLQETTKKKYIFHNAKYDYSILKQQTGKSVPIYMDTMVAHYVSRPGYDDKMDRRSLQFTAQQEISAPAWKGDITKCQFEHKDIAAAYNTRDICYTFGLSMMLWKSMQRIRPLWEDIEMPFVEILAEAEMEGISLDAVKLAEIEVRLKARMVEIEKELKEFSGNPEFNIGSTQQLSELIFGKMEVKPVRKCRVCTYQGQEDTKTCPKCQGVRRTREGDQTTPDSFQIKRCTPGGKPSLDKIALEDLSKLNISVAKLVIEYRAAQKLVSSYTNLPSKANPRTGKIHPTYHQVRTASGRLCVAKGTLIDVVRDVSKFTGGIPIEDVRIGDLAYTYDDALNLTLKPIVWSGVTGHKKVLRIHWLGTGRHTSGFIDLTPNHEVRLTDGRYVRACDLKSGDSVLALSRSLTSGYSRLHSTGHPVMRDHKFIYEKLNNVLLDGSKAVHHRDGNKLNNLPTNLELMSVSDHSKMHFIEIGKDEDVRRSRSIRASGYWKSGKFTARCGSQASNFKDVSKFKLLRMIARAKGKLKFVDMDFDTYKRKCVEAGINPKALHYRWTEDGRYICRKSLETALSLPATTGAKALGVTFRRMKKLFELFGKQVSDNHTITYVETIEDEVDVYDIEVEDTHNFIANELCIHNSCSNPNFQQLPKRTAKYIRDTIIPSPGYCLVAADYAGQEIRILAAYSGDEKLITAYNPCFHCEHNKHPDRICHLGKGTCSYEDHSHEDSKCNVMDIHSYITGQVYKSIIDVPISQIKDHPKWDKYRTSTKGVTFALDIWLGALYSNMQLKTT